MSEFTKVTSVKKLKFEKRAERASEDDVEDLLKSLETKKQVLKESKFYGEVLESIRDLKVVKLRSLALGSPAQELQAIFQLAFLLLVVEDLKIENVSLYDPVFAPLDKTLFEKLDLKVEEEYVNGDIDNTLYFLPHAPLELTNEFLETQTPKYLLANNLQSHTDRLTSSELFKVYPFICKAVSLLDPNDKIEDDFEPVVRKKKNRKKKIEEPAKIDYDSIDTYFKTVEVKSFKDLELEYGPWLNSFTDLSFHKLL